MKWIGQQIYDQVVRFRNQVFFEADTVTFTSDNADDPQVIIENTTNDDQGSRLILQKLRADDAVDTGQNLGEIWFTGQDSGQSFEEYAYIIGEIDVSTDGQESGKLHIGVAAHNGTNISGLILTGGSVGTEVDVAIGSGAASVTTVAGILTMGSTQFANSEGVIQVANQATINHDSLANFVANEHIDWTSGGGSTIHPSNIPTLNQDTTGSAATVTSAAQTNITSLGTLTNLVVDNTTINGAEITCDTNFTITSANDLALVSTGNDVSVDTDNFVIESTASQKPLLTLKTTHTDKDNSGELQFLKDAADTEDGEDLGLITFYGEDEGNNNTLFGQIKGAIAESDEGAEGGKVTIAVATHDGELQDGLVVQDGNAEDEIDVTLGFGAASVTNIKGTLAMGSTAAMTNAGLLSVANQSSVTGLGTITSGVWNGTRIESAYLDNDTAHLTTDQTFTGTKTFNEKIVGQTITQRWVKNINYVATQGTTETFLPMAGSAENTNVANGNLPILMPTAGKLLKVHLKTQRDHSGVTTTIKMYNWDADEAHGSSTDTLLGTQQSTGPAANAVGIFDFTSLSEGSTNAFTAGEMIAFSITNSSAVSSSCKYFVTLVFEMEWDY